MSRSRAVAASPSTSYRWLPPLRGSTRTAISPSEPQPSETWEDSQSLPLLPPSHVSSRCFLDRFAVVSSLFTRAAGGGDPWGRPLVLGPSAYVRFTWGRWGAWTAGVGAKTLVGDYAPTATGFLGDDGGETKSMTSSPSLRGYASCSSRVRSMASASTSPETKPAATSWTYMASTTASSSSISDIPTPSADTIACKWATSGTRGAEPLGAASK